MRKISVLLLMALFLESMSAIGVHGNDGLQSSGNSYAVRYTLIGNLTCSISITGNTAALSARVSAGNSTVTDCEMTLELQERVAFIWITKSSWTQSSHGSSLSMNKQSTANREKTYRLKVTATVYSSSSSESASKTAIP
ncbi:MAG: hypothetical protein J5728_10865 [Lachnospiraceae bacterium]|nr:hypothetical protein [Lachnospiraceae bacterium]